MELYFSCLVRFPPATLGFRPMPHKHLHYLRSERRRSALTQTDIAALLGGAGKARISRYERGFMPPTHVALAYEVIMGKPVAELLGGAFEETAFRVRRRASDLLRRERSVATPRRLRRRRTLERIAT